MLDRSSHISTWTATPHSGARHVLRVRWARGEVRALRDVKACVDCHFFVKTTFVHPDRVVQIVSESERRMARGGDFGWVREADALSCNRGVWDEGHNFDLGQRAAVMVETNRTDSCFFWPYQPGMFLPAARELQARESEGREAKRSRRPAWIGVAAGVAGVAAGYLTAAGAQHWWPF